MDTKDTVLETLKKSSEPLKSGDVVEKTGLDKKDVDKAIKSLKDAGLIDSPKRCFYSAK
jgi:biotin operon repressor